ncbi:MAG: hypothetical protein KGQ66_16560 [Acidobacteriota bacterium]|nr:hypothetical protein [Acidobacteriota bacterium]
MRRVATVSLGLAAAVALSSCGGSPGLSPGISSRLQAEVGAVRAAAVSHQASVAAARLDELRFQVALLRQQGQISPAKAAAILTAAAAVQAQLASVEDPATTVPTTAPGTTTTTAPTAAPTTAAPTTVASTATSVGRSTAPSGRPATPAPGSPNKAKDGGDHPGRGSADG